MGLRHAKKGSTISEAWEITGLSFQIPPSEFISTKWLGPPKLTVDVTLAALSCPYEASPTDPTQCMR
jgi:hypothetical protein